MAGWLGNEVVVVVVSVAGTEVRQGPMTAIVLLWFACLITICLCSFVVVAVSLGLFNDC